jgi:hypothetical protein
VRIETLFVENAEQTPIIRAIKVASKGENGCAKRNTANTSCIAKASAASNGGVEAHTIVMTVLEL